MKKMNVLIASVLVILMAATLLSGCGTVEKPSAVGVVDMQKIMKESTKIKEMQEKLTAKAKALMEQLEKDRAAMTPEEFQKKEQAAYAEFTQMKQEFESQIEAQTKKVLEEIAKEKKLGAVVYKNGMAWGGIDVTDEVLKKLQ